LREVFSETCGRGEPEEKLPVTVSARKLAYQLPVEVIVNRLLETVPEYYE